MRLRRLFHKKWPVALIAATLAALIAFGLSYSWREPQGITLNEFVEEIQSGKIASVEYVPSRKHSDYIDYSFKNKEGVDVVVLVPSIQALEINQLLIKKHIPITTNVRGNTTSAVESAFRAFVLTGLVVLLLMYVIGLRGFNDTLKPQKSSVKFADVAGINDVRDDVQLAIEFLKDPKRVTALGGKPPRGILFIGPPGNGKTLIAKAVAGEAGVPFLHCPGSDFVEMFVGTGAARIRELFKTAKKYAPCIIFFDEIDSFGSRTPSGGGGGAQEYNQTINALLTELDGFEDRDNIIVIGATNRPEVLDEAILRPGRFDRRVFIPQPSMRSRKEILQVTAKNRNLKLDPKVNLDYIAKLTSGFSGASLVSLLNEAAIHASIKKQSHVTTWDLEWAHDRVLRGDERNEIMSPRERYITAYHEAGHALVTIHSSTTTDSMHKVTILARGQSLGASIRIGNDKQLYTRNQLVEEMAIALGGRISEELVLEPEHLTSGAANDLQQVTKIAWHMVTQFGMKCCEKSLLSNDRVYHFSRHAALSPTRPQSDEQCPFSEETMLDIDEAIACLVKAARKHAENILTTQREDLDKIARALLERETLSEEDLRKLVPFPITKMGS